MTDLGDPMSGATNESREPESGSDEPEVREHPERHRFEIWLGGELAGFTVYQRAGNVYAFVHTEIDDRFAGKGLASILIKQTLDEMRAREMAVLPICPFVRRYIARHPDYLTLVPPDQRASFGLPEPPA